LRLDQLQRRKAAVIVGLRQPADEHESDLVLRLAEIGFIPGEEVRIVAHGFPGLEPLAVRIGHTTFALRAHEAALVEVAPLESAA
jgi:ferrous iron transport protein A